MTTFKEIFVLFLKKKKILPNFKHYSTSKDMWIRGGYAENDIFADLEEIEKEGLDVRKIVSLFSDYFLWIRTNEGFWYWSHLSDDWKELLISNKYNTESLKKTIIENPNLYK